MKQFFNYFKSNSIFIFVTTTVIFVFAAWANGPYMFADEVKDGETIMIKADTLKIDSLALLTDSFNALHQTLVDEVDSYMVSVVPRHRMDATHIVNECLSYNYDIPLLLSQCQAESSLGARTSGNSCFGVVNRKYPTINDAVSDYIKIMREHYIIERTPEQLIASNFKRERSSLKYAGNPAYGQTIGGIRSNILRRTNIAAYFQQLQQLKLEIDGNNKETD